MPAIRFLGLPSRVVVPGKSYRELTGGGAFRRRQHPAAARNLTEQPAPSASASLWARSLPHLNEGTHATDVSEKLRDRGDHDSGATSRRTASCTSSGSTSCSVRATAPNSRNLRACGSTLLLSDPTPEL